METDGPRRVLECAVVLAAAWALVGGLAEIFAGFGSGETAGTRAMFIIGTGGNDKGRSRSLRAARY